MGSCGSKKDVSDVMKSPTQAEKNLSEQHTPSTLSRPEKSTGCCGGEKITFSYKRKGQEWGEFGTIGQSQSPINIEESTGDSSAFQVVYPDSTNYRSLQLAYNPSPLITCTRGSGNFIIKDCITGSFTGVPIGAAQPQQFNLTNIHFHSPSEHQINGQSFPLEMHIVHQDASGARAVIAVLFEDTKEVNAILTAAVVGDSLDLNRELGNVIEDFYFYSGSLTTPPCSEPVHWFIKRQPLKATHHQLRFFKEMWPDNPKFAGGNGNNREIQPRNGRTVYLFKVTPKCEQGQG